MTTIDLFLLIVGPYLILKGWRDRSDLDVCVGALVIAVAVAQAGWLG